VKNLKKVLLVFVLITLTACAPGMQYTRPPGITLVPGTDLPQQVATIVASALTQTALPSTVTSFPMPSTPIPATLPVNYSAGQKAYQSSSFGIQFSYPEAWYVQEVASSQDIWGVAQPIPAIQLTSFDPSNPPHKLEWTDQTVSVQFRMLPYVTVQFYKSLDTWVENARQVALANQLSIYAEERFLIANQSAADLTLVSGSGGIIHQVLTILNGRYFEINIEAPNFNLARTVLDTIQPTPLSGLKPADSDTPAAGVCGSAPGDPVNIILGLDTSGMPLAGRCIAVNPIQHIKLTNQSANPLVTTFAGFQINLPVGGEMLLDKPVGQYLALGVHFLPMGPELWLKVTSVPTSAPIPPPVATVPPPVVVYSNPEVGYRLGLPGDWSINETNGTNKQVRFSPPYSTDPNIIYLIIGLDFRFLDQIINDYAQNFPDAVREDVNFYGNSGIKYTHSYGRNEYYIPYENRIFLIVTDKPNDTTVQSILMTIHFTASSTTYETTIMDNGRTINMKTGDYLKINLDWSYDWSGISVSDTNVLDGSQATYQARFPGSASLTATGNPKCLNSTPPCLAPSILYTINVIVQ